MKHFLFLLLCLCCTGSLLRAQEKTIATDNLDAKKKIKLRSAGVLEVAGYQVTGISNDPTLDDSSTVHLVTEAGVKAYVDANAGGVTGTGTINYLPKWSAAAVLGNSQILDSGSDVTVQHTSANTLMKINRNGGSELYFLSQGTGTGSFIYTNTNTNLGIGTNGATRLTLSAAGKIFFNTYGSGTHAGTAATFPAFETGGGVIEFDAGGFRTAVGAGTGSGSVTSVGLSLPAMFTVSGSPVTTSGTLSATLTSQSANLVFVAPDGSAGAPTFRTLVNADLPTVAATKGGTGLTTYTTGDILYSSATNTLSKLAAGTNGHVLTLAGGVPTWAASGGTPGGSNTQIQYNNSGSFAGSANLTWDNSNQRLGITNASPTHKLDISTTAVSGSDTYVNISSGSVDGNRTGFRSERTVGVGIFGVVNSGSTPRLEIRADRKTTYYPSISMYTDSVERVTINRYGAVAFNGSFGSSGSLLVSNGNASPPTWSSTGYWSLTGNAGTNPASNFLGTTDSKDFVFRTKNTERMRFDTVGRIGVNVTVPTDAIDCVVPSALTAAGNSFLLFRSTGSDSNNTGFMAERTVGKVSMYVKNSGGDPAAYIETVNKTIYTPDLRFIVNGSERVRIQTDGHLRLSNLLYQSDGTASAPSDTYTSDTNTGTYRPAADTWAVTTGGTERIRVNTTSLLIPDGLAATPGIAWGSDTNTGLRRQGADWLNIVTNGADALSVSSTNIDSYLPHGLANGSAAAPSLNFTNSSTTGFFRKANNDIGITINGTQEAYFNAAEGLVMSAARFQTRRGANVASAGDLTLGADGNLFIITGTTTINAITNTNWQQGAEITFLFAGSVTVKNATAGGAGTAQMNLAGGADFSATANDILKLIYDGTTWVETGRSVN